MKIKKKAPKPSSRRPPPYFVGYRGTAPLADELKIWFDLEYGGPLIVRQDQEARESWQVNHGPWSAHIVIPLPESHRVGLKDQFAWEHDMIGTVAPSMVPPCDMPDTILSAARLARGLTLLTQGTSCDITTQQYLNPSDWKDQELMGFLITDHILISQDDNATTEEIRHYTLGLSKFGLDDLEIFQSRGLPERIAEELLIESAHELIRLGRSPKVGTALHLPLLGRTVRIASHRTASPRGRMLSFREIRT